MTTHLSTSVIKIMKTVGQKYFFEFLSQVPAQVCKAFQKEQGWTTSRFQEVLNVLSPWYRRHCVTADYEDSLSLLGFEIDSDDNWHDIEQTDLSMFEPSPQFSEYDRNELIFDNSDSPEEADYY